MGSSIPSIGSRVFLSPITAGKLTATEPTTAGLVSMQLGVMSESTKMYVDLKRSLVSGYSVTNTNAVTGALILPNGTQAQRPSSPINGMVRYNSESASFEGYANNFWSGIGGGGTTDRVNQAHTFLVGDVLYLNGSTYTKARADAANTAEVVGMVSRVIDSNQFEITLSGEVSGLTGLTTGEVYFLSETTPGAITITEPSVVGQISLPVGVASSTTSLYVAPKRGAVVGSSNTRTQIPLVNNATTTIQNASAYDAGELTGWITITATTPLRFYTAAQFTKNGAATNYNLSYQFSGDTPPAGFSMTITSTGLIQITLPNITGFSSASINFAINAPALGVTLPLNIPSSQISGDTNPVGTLLDYAGTTAPTGYLMCDGRSLTTAAYPALFAVVGYAYGGGGANFNIPDFRGRFARYLDNMGGTAAGRDSGRTHGTDQGYGTKAPNNAFSVSTSGNKNQFNNDQNGHGHNSNASPGPGDAPQGGWGLIQRSFSNQWTPSSDTIGAGFELRADATPLGLSIYTNTATWSPVNFSTSGSVSNQTGSGDSETRPINLCLNAIIKI